MPHDLHPGIIQLKDVSASLIGIIDDEKGYGFQVAAPGTTKILPHSKKCGRGRRNFVLRGMPHQRLAIAHGNSGQAAAAGAN